MKKWEDITAAVTGNWPGTLNINESAPDNFDGTPLLAEWVNNLWGWVQDVLTRADLSPDGNVEAEGASQISSAIQRMKGLPGEVMQYMGQTDPASISDPPRVLLLDGSLIQVSLYQDLVDACWVGSSDNATADMFYRTNSGDTIRSNSGTHFRLADARGQFVRGLDVAGVVDQDGAGRKTGSIQGMAIVSHFHSVRSAVLSDYMQNNSGPNVAAGTDLRVPTIITSESGDYFLAGGILGSYPPTSGPDNRPTNMVSHLAIWY